MGITDTGRVYLLDAIFLRYREKQGFWNSSTLIDGNIITTQSFEILSSSMKIFFLLISKWCWAVGDTSLLLKAKFLEIISYCLLCLNTRRLVWWKIVRQLIKWSPQLAIGGFVCQGLDLSRGGRALGVPYKCPLPPLAETLLWQIAGWVVMWGLSDG